MNFANTYAHAPTSGSVSSVALVKAVNLRQTADVYLHQLDPLIKAAKLGKEAVLECPLFKNIRTMVEGFVDRQETSVLPSKRYGKFSLLITPEEQEIFEFLGSKMRSGRRVRKSIVLAKDQGGLVRPFHDNKVAVGSTLYGPRSMTSTLVNLIYNRILLNLNLGRLGHRRRFISDVIIIIWLRWTAACQQWQCVGQLGHIWRRVRGWAGKFVS